ncbi:MAG: T9SS type A sorting domain-containing protein [Candidatus Marinimicrobia bacterium]|jgi:endonuclease/exonuclease/phosphatase family metal-dependent hydrolase|nr:T9SS type A sorting domain-containing protein [Candidatus Neomarinimicrobiota bacterium]MBT3495827.1 T9SS type A sorting domain-containing protein [Candidatus Neomarinimicrobiota bacterium]MBT3692453.1 T9SS type A sorting domain-containing protein [Candidatus Neomarinimicrobiota bacterium]MBT3731528.1 T9SS type A sorting domain-containing protein [Candidatus Neomarinimicrobiota bacterium]MBT4143883.1 T9SS type A sorting domain-containing protein [Candidatus Neomarinimicrobiota bacterium]
MKKWILFGLLSSLVLASSTRIMTYNLLNYNDEDDREDDFVTILNFVEPDLIIAEEVNGNDGFNHFKSDVLDVTDPNDWTGANFINQSASQDIALYYRHDIFSFVSTSTIPTAQTSGTRDVVEWVMKHNESDIEFRIYGVHLKASSGGTNADTRLAETTILRDYLNQLEVGTRYIVAGDFNIYSNSSSSEPAFEMLTGEQTDNDGRLFDPIDRIGDWHNDSSYSDVHTQSPRGGNFGGMDDRFDWLFVSEILLDETSDMHYITDTYWAVGNDGNHFNQSINDGNNTSVSTAVADALYDASDHLPVYMDMWFDDLVYSDSPIVITEIMPNPSAVSDANGEWIELYNQGTETVDIHGWHLKDADSDDHIFTNIAMSILLEPESYYVFCRNSDSGANGDINAFYDYDGFSLSNSSDEVILTDDTGAIVDEIYYDGGFPFGSGVSMEIHDLDADNNLAENWHASTLSYGDGDLGTPGYSWEGLSNGVEILTPKAFHLYPAYPNPFNPMTTIRFSVETQLMVSLRIFDMNGRMIETLFKGTAHRGDHKYQWNANLYPSGIYFARLTMANTSQTQKIVLIK